MVPNNKTFTIFTMAVEQPFSFIATLEGARDGYTEFYLDGDPEKVFKVKTDMVVAMVEEPVVLKEINTED